MRTSLDCIPCLIRQTLSAARMVTDDSALHASILRKVLHWTARMDLGQPPPVMAQRIHRYLHTIHGENDLYRRTKAHHNRMALKLLPELQEKVTTASDPLETAVRLAIAGNVIDMGVNSEVTENELRQAVNGVLTESFTGELDAFRKALSRAQNILYLADNAGEIVFDRLLIQEMGPERVTLAVRGFPILNDATMADARAAGLHEMVRIIDNGSDAPGTILEQCNEDFNRLFHRVDLIIAKGQGNFETLGDVQHSIFFLFKVKCPVIAHHSGRPLGTHVLLRSDTVYAPGDPEEAPRIPP